MFATPGSASCSLVPSALARDLSHCGLTSDTQNQRVCHSTDRVVWRSRTSTQVDKGLSSWNQPYPACRSQLITLSCCIAVVPHFRVLILQRGKQCKGTVEYDRKAPLHKWPINSVDSEILRMSSSAVILEDSQKIEASQNSGLIYINKSRKCFTRGAFIISLAKARKIGNADESAWFTVALSLALLPLEYNRIPRKRHISPLFQLVFSTQSTASSASSENRTFSIA